MALPPGVIGAGAVKQVDDAQATLGVLLNPDISTDQIRALIQAGQGMYYTSGIITAAANQATQIFSPNTSTKGLIIYSARLSYTNSAVVNKAYLLGANADPAMSTAGIIGNQKLGGGAYGGAVLVTTGVNATPIGTFFDIFLNPLNQSVELLPQGSVIYVPAGVNGGLAIYSATTAAGTYAVTFKGVEV